MPSPALARDRTTWRTRDKHMGLPLSDRDRLCFSCVLPDCYADSKKCPRYTTSWAEAKAAGRLGRPRAGAAG